MVLPELIHAAELSLAAATGEPVRLRAAGIVADTPASHVVRVENIGSKRDLPRSLIVKAAKLEFPVNSQQMIFNEWAALRYLQDLHCDPPVEVLCRCRGQRRLLHCDGRPGFR
jgi:hypothetical protein